MKIRPLATQFRIRNRNYLQKKRTGQVALYTVHTAYNTSLLGFEVLVINPASGRSIGLPDTLLEVYPPNDSVLSFGPDAEVDAWTAFQNLIDKQGRKG